MTTQLTHTKLILTADNDNVYKGQKHVHGSKWLILHDFPGPAVYYTYGYIYPNVPLFNCYSQCSMSALCENAST